MGTTERREREKDQRRNNIIDAAEKVFFTKGINAATMDDVAAEAELSKGTLYLYFKNKDDLYFAINLRGTRILKSMFEEAVAQYERGIEKVRAVGEAYLRYSVDYANYFKTMIYYESQEIDFKQENAYATACAVQGKETMDVLISAIRTGIADGSIRPEIEPEKTAIVLWAETTGLIQIAVLKSELIKMQHQIESVEVIRYAFDLIYHSLKSN